MPIYDNNGTTSAEIGKLYDNNGTTSYQTGKVYDNNGTTNSLIYSAEEYLLENGVVQSLAGGFTLHKQQYSSGLYYEDGCIHYQNHNSQAMSRVDTNNNINWGNYSKLCFRMGASSFPYSNFIIAIQSVNPSDDTWIQYTTYEERLLFEEYASTSFSDDQILTFDISGITANSKLLFGMINNVGDVYIKDIWVE